MSLVAVGVAPVVADLPAWANNGFWPPIDPHAMREAHRLDGTVTPARLHAAIVFEGCLVNRQLRALQLAAQAAGQNTVADLPRQDWQAADHYQALYCEAVYCYAHAHLFERYRDLTAHGRAAPGDAGDAEPAAAYRASGFEAVSAILDKPRGRAELL